MNKLNNIPLLRKAMLEKDSVSFTIEAFDGIKFICRCLGHEACISVYDMPWEYKDIDHWKTIAPLLIGNEYQANVFNIIENPTSIFLTCHKFLSPRYLPIVERWHKGVILSIKDYGLFIDIGYDSGWKSSTEIGLMHISYLAPEDSPYSYIIGDEILVQIIAVDDATSRISYGLGKPQNEIMVDPLDIIGAEVKIIVGISERGNKIYKINEYGVEIEKAQLPDGSPVSLKRMRKLRKKFKQGKEIMIKTETFNNYKKTYSAIWIDAPPPYAARQKAKKDYF